MWIAAKEIHLLHNATLQPTRTFYFSQSRALKSALFFSRVQQSNLLRELNLFLFLYKYNARNVRRSNLD